MKILRNYLGNFDKLFDEIALIKDSELNPIFLRSEVPHFMKIFGTQRHGINRQYTMAMNFYHALEQLQDDFFHGIGIWKNQREREIPFELKKLLPEFHKICLDVSPKSKISALQYYQYIIEDQFVPGTDLAPMLYYLNNDVLRFLKDGQIIIVPLEDLLNLHLNLGHYNKLGTIVVKSEVSNWIYFRREYTRWNGVGKDNDEVVSYYRLCPNRLQIESIKNFDIN